MEQGCSLRVAISGASGLVGSAVADSLRADGHHVERLVRRRGAAADEIYWDPLHGTIEGGKLDGIDGVVHLAGENLAARPWTARQRERLRESRVAGTRLISETLASVPHPPTVLVNASAIGFYGDRGEEELGEDSGPGTGFLAELCRAWEEATAPAEQAGIRVVKLRIGVVISERGGVLPRMMTPFRLGIGGRIGDGRQYMSWIGLADLTRIVRRALVDSELRGPLNAVAPQPVTGAEFARILGRVLGRPALLPVPAFVIRGLLREMGRELLLASTRVLPRKLLEAGFRFDHADLEQALRHTLDRSDR